MNMKATSTLIDLTEIRTRVDAVLNRLSAELVAQPAVARLGQIAAGLAIIEADSVPQDAAGFGSTVIAENIATGEVEEYTLMVGSLVDLDAAQVSLASPIGQALLGCMAGDEVTIATPHRQVTLRITSVVTLLDLLDRHESGA